MQNDQKSKAYAVVFRFVKENLWLFGLGLLCSMLNTAFNSLTPQIIRMTVDSIIGSEALQPQRGEPAGQLLRVRGASGAAHE